MSWILTLRMLREVLGYSVLGGGAVTLLFLGGNVPRHLADFVTIGFASSDVGLLFGTLAGVVGTYVVPIAFLFGVLLTMGRMASDREVLAMQVCGMGLHTLVIPILGLALVATALTGYLAQEVEWRSRQQMRRVATSLATRGTTLEPGQFLPLAGRVVYVKDQRVDGSLDGVMIFDYSDPERPLLILAEHGSFGIDEERGEYRFRLETGEVHIEPRRNSDEYQRISFVTFDYAFDIRGLFEVHDWSLRPYDMSNAKLREILALAEAGESLQRFAKKQAVHYQLELHRRVALPLAPVLFALVGVPLGIRVRRGTRSWGALLCGLLAFLYYLVTSFGRQMSYEGVIPAAVAMWAPNATFAVLAVVLLIRARRMAE